MTSDSGQARDGCAGTAAPKLTGSIFWTLTAAAPASRPLLFFHWVQPPLAHPESATAADAAAPPPLPCRVSLLLLGQWSPTAPAVVSISWAQLGMGRQESATARSMELKRRATWPICQHSPGLEEGAAFGCCGGSDPLAGGGHG